METICNCGANLEFAQRVCRTCAAQKFIAELELKIAKLAPNGFPPDIPLPALVWIKQFDGSYTLKKDYEQTIYALQRDNNLPITVPRHIKIMPITTEQGKLINATFERVAGV